MTIPSYNTKVYLDQNGNELVVAAGGAIAAQALLGYHQQRETFPFNGMTLCEGIDDLMRFAYGNPSLLQSDMAHPTAAMTPYYGAMMVAGRIPYLGSTSSSGSVSCAFAA